MIGHGTWDDFLRSIVREKKLVDVHVTLRPIYKDVLDNIPIIPLRTEDYVRTQQTKNQ